MTGPVILIAVFVAGLASANYASNTRQSDSSWGVARRTGTVDSERLPLGLAARRRANLPTYPGYSADDRKEGTRKRRGRPTRRPHLSAKTERPTLPPKLQSAQYPPQDPAGSDQQQPPPAPTPPAYPYPGGTPPHPGRPYPPPVQSLPPQYPPAPQYPRGPYYPQGRPQYPGTDWVRTPYYAGPPTTFAGGLAPVLPVLPYGTVPGFPTPQGSPLYGSSPMVGQPFQAGPPATFGGHLPPYWPYLHHQQTPNTYDIRRRPSAAGGLPPYWPYEDATSRPYTRPYPSSYSPYPSYLPYGPSGVPSGQPQQGLAKGWVNPNTYVSVTAGSPISTK
ncbi:calcium-binding protein P-like isoform X2 [Ornithodoros turicata]|uniref:calcium-binding protein P-like isoform X2 n=1 Tax=Ornithodoros turicata TaxID=34597 RepID=UPI003138C513